MTDVKIENNDVALDSAGRMVYLNGADALFQRAAITASVGRISPTMFLRFFRRKQL